MQRGDILEKPILFNTEMTKAILDGRKSRTSRPIKPQPPDELNHLYGFVGWSTDKKDIGKVCWTVGETCDGRAHMVRPQYQVGDILWVRETWQYIDFAGEDNGYVYKTSQNGMDWEQNSDDWKWHPSIHMPRVAARIFLKVTGIKVQRIQDITEDECLEEGIDEESGDYLKAEHYQEGGSPIQGGSPAIFTFIGLWDGIYASPQPKKEHGVITHYESYPWDVIQGAREYMGLPWIVHGNPWIWAYEFERVDKHE